jgi:hypothetical protein
VAEAKLVDEVTIPFQIGALEVFQETATFADHHQQAAPSVVILGVCPEMIRERIDAFGQQGYLNPC